MKNKNIPSNYKDEIYEDYFINNLSTKQISEKYELTHVSVQKHISSKYGLKSISEAMNKHNLDIEILSKIDQEWKAYFLGWLISDGNIYIKSKKWTISLCIQENDKYILDYFNLKFFNGSKKLNFRPARIKKGTDFLCKPLYRFQIDSKHLCEKLISYGIVPDKSSIIKFPNIIPEALMPHFIRGIFEGDGCISTNNVYSKTVTIFSASESFILSLRKEIEKLGIVPMIYKNKELYILRFGKKYEIKLFFDFIYNNCEQKLMRKYEKFLL